MATRLPLLLLLALTSRALAQPVTRAEVESVLAAFGAEGDSTATSRLLLPAKGLGPQAALLEVEARRVQLTTSLSRASEMLIIDIVEASNETRIVARLGLGEGLPAYLHATFVREPLGPRLVSEYVTPIGPQAAEERARIQRAATRGLAGKRGSATDADTMTELMRTDPTLADAAVGWQTRLSRLPRHSTARLDEVRRWAALRPDSVAWAYIAYDEGLHAGDLDLARRAVEAVRPHSAGDPMLGLAEVPLALQAGEPAQAAAALRVLPLGADEPRNVTVMRLRVAAGTGDVAGAEAALGRLTAGGRSWERDVEGPHRAALRASPVVHAALRRLSASPPAAQPTGRLVIDYSPVESGPVPPAPPGFEALRFQGPAGALPMWISTSSGGDAVGVLYLPHDVGRLGAPWAAATERPMPALAEVLRRKGVVVAVPGLRGRQGSAGDASGLIDEVDDVLAALRALASRPGVDPKRIVLVGERLGASLALRVAARTDAVAAVVAIEPVLRFDAAWQLVFGLSPPLMDPGHEKEPRSEPVVAGASAEALRLRSPESEVGRLRVPVLLVVPADASLRGEDAEISRARLYHLSAPRDRASLVSTPVWSSESWRTALDRLLATAIAAGAQGLGGVNQDAVDAALRPSLDHLLAARTERVVRIGAPSIESLIERTSAEWAFLGDRRPDRAAARASVEAAVASLRKEALSWPAETDVDRLMTALQALAGKGFAIRLRSRAHPVLEVPASDGPGVATLSVDEEALGQTLAAARLPMALDVSHPGAWTAERARQEIDRAFREVGLRVETGPGGRDLVVPLQWSRRPPPR